MNYISIIFGLLLGFLLGIGSKHYVLSPNYHGPNSNNIQKTIYETADGKYYKFKPKVCICPL